MSDSACFLTFKFWDKIEIWTRYFIFQMPISKVKWIFIFNFSSVRPININNAKLMLLTFWLPSIQELHVSCVFIISLIVLVCNRNVNLYFFSTFFSSIAYNNILHLKSLSTHGWVRFSIYHVRLRCQKRRFESTMYIAIFSLFILLRVKI